MGPMQEDQEQNNHRGHNHHLLGLKISENLVLLLQLIHLLAKFWTLRLDRDCKLRDGCSLGFLITCNSFLVGEKVRYTILQTSDPLQSVVE